MEMLLKLFQGMVIKKIKVSTKACITLPLVKYMLTVTLIGLFMYMH